ncbi:MAG: hypothetical protein GC203_20685 [Phenylobacterium sp.]|uniref:hypothetical protein n=1 Tax=Phenylobacterium sp. TaxID=1871053 RepID=UPI0025FDA391|nr:hypothetical protein [Phenylobacterium sp.]MBI1200283.1 hypothetical protein [Phenylobacterium sp.]
MGTLSARAALGAGFRLIAREPLAFAAWCGAYFLVGVVPQLVMLDALVPLMAAFMASGGDPNDAAFVAAEARMARYSILSYLSSFVTITVIPGAVFRAILAPDERRFFYLRIGAQEGWLGLSVLAVFGLFLIGSLVLALPVALVAAFAPPLAPLATAGGMAALIWGVLRVSFTPVMGFADHNFRVAESWQASRPHMNRLLLVAAGLFVLVLGGYVLLVTAGSAVFALDPGADAVAAAWKSNPAGVIESLGAGRIAGLLVVITVFATWMHVMGAAAWASMYRDLKAPAA